MYARSSAFLWEPTPPPSRPLKPGDAIANGADEVDMVINIGALKSGDLALLESDIRGVVELLPARW